MADGRPLLRLGVINVPPYINRCVLNATSFDDLKSVCRSGTGFNIMIIRFMLFALAPKFRLQFVPVKQLATDEESYNHSFANGLADMSLQFYMPTYERSQLFSFSRAVLNVRSGFIVSRKSYESHDSEIRIQPFDLVTFACVVATWLIMVTFDAIVMAITFTIRFKYLKLRQGIGFYGNALADFSDFSGLNNRALTKLRIGWPVTLAFILGWSAVLRFAYSSFVTASLVHKERPPFTSIHALENRARRNLHRAVLYPGFFKQLILAGNFPALVGRSIFARDAQEALSMVSAHPDIVLPDTSLTALVLMKKNCRDFGYIEVPDLLEWGSGFIFRKNFPHMDAFNRIVTQFQEDVQRRSESELTALGYRCPTENERAYHQILSIGHFQSMIVSYIIVCACAIVILLLEIWPYAGANYRVETARQYEEKHRFDKTQVAQER